MSVLFLYINHERDWREQSFSAGSGTLDIDRCMVADMVIECSQGRFTILKNRYGENELVVEPTPKPNRYGQNPCEDCGRIMSESDIESYSIECDGIGGQRADGGFYPKTISIPRCCSSCAEDRRT